MTSVRVTHLVDDTTAGGVMRVVDYMMTTPELAHETGHSLLKVNRNSCCAGQIDADVIISHLAISWRLLPFLVSLRALNPSARLVHVEHSYTRNFTALNVRRNRRFGALLKLSYSMFHDVVAVSAAQGQWLRKEDFVRPDALLVIPSCVDLSGFRELAPREGAVRTIGAIGRLEPQKGFDLLIRAFRGIRDRGLALHIYGQGAEEQLLRTLAAGDPRIHFKGFSSNPVAALAGLDAVMMPSRWEAYGLVAIETLAAGRRLLVSNADGLTDHVAQGATLVDGLAVKTWQSALEDLFAEPPRPSGPGRAYNYERHFSGCWKALCLSSSTARRVKSRTS